MSERHIWLLSSGEVLPGRLLLVLNKHIFTALCLRNDPAWKMLTWEGWVGGGGGGAWLTYESGLAHFDLPCPLFTPSQYTICQLGLAIYKIPPPKNVSKYAPLQPQNMPSLVQCNSRRKGLRICSAMPRKTNGMGVYQTSEGPLKTLIP